jgi:polyhydroxyalkanoate synthase
MSVPSGAELVESPAADAAGLWEELVDEAYAVSFLPELPPPADDDGEGSIADRLLSGPVKLAERAIESAANVYDLTIGGAGATPMAKPFRVIDEGPQRKLVRYEPRGLKTRGSILLVPPLAAPVSCFDLRPGLSLVDYLTRLDYTTYVVDYGPIGFADRDLGLEHWIDEVIPTATKRAAEDAGEEVHTAGWCLGGIMASLTAAAHPELPTRSLTMVASPFDFDHVGLLDPIRKIGEYTGGAILSSLFRLLGGVPAPLVSAGFRLTAIDRSIRKPAFVARNLANREALVHMRAVDRYMSHMLAYPGRSIGQMYRAFFFDGQLKKGVVEIGGREIDLREVRMPVLAIGGRGDVLAPIPAVHHVGDLLSGASEVRLESAPGGHLGVLTGMSSPNNTWQMLRDFAAGH